MGHVGDVLGSGATAVAMASLLHYNAIRHHDMRDADYQEEINLAHLDRPGFGRIEDVGLPELKRFLATKGVVSRLQPQETLNV